MKKFIVSALLLFGLCIAFLYFTFFSKSAEHQAVPPLPVSSQRDNLEVKDWDTKFPQLPDHPLVSATQRSGPAYGAAKDSITLYLSEFDDKFTCATDTPTPHKAIFATIAQYAKGTDFSGPYKPDATATVGNYTYALYSAGANCYGATTSQVQGIFAAYAKIFSAEPIR